MYTGKPAKVASGGGRQGGRLSRRERGQDAFPNRGRGGGGLGDEPWGGQRQRGDHAEGRGHHHRSRREERLPI
jgi:hypothetical protein